jgi:hypothetical protein
LMNAIQSLSSQNANTSLPRNDMTVAVSDNDIDMLDDPEARNFANPSVVAIPEPSSNVSTRKRALTDEPTTSIASKDVKSSTIIHANATYSDKRRKVSKYRFEAAAVSNGANDEIEKAETRRTKRRINMSSSYKVMKNSSKPQKVISPKRGPKPTNTAIATENSIEDMLKAVADIETIGLPLGRTIRSRRLTKKVYVTKDFLVKWQVKPVKRPFGRPEMIADAEKTHLPSGVIEAINLETDWFSKILGFAIPGFQNVLPFFTTFEFDPEIDAKILKGLKASASDKDLKGVAEVVEDPEDEDEDDGNLIQFQSTKVSKEYMIWSGLDLSLPPLHSLPDIFEDMVSKGLEMKLEKQKGPEKYNSLQLQDVVDYLGGRKLRIGTMCSGTECPVLALGMINDGEFL